MSFQIEIDHVNEKNRSVQDLPKNKVPGFVRADPDLDKIRRKAEENSEYENLVVIGNGGSVTSFRAYLYAFMPETDLNVRIVTTPEPDFLNRVSSEMRPENTIVMPISKSGETVTVIESLLYFLKREYDVFGITSDNDGALKQILEKTGSDWIEHLDVGGRFSGATETALVPAAFAGIDIREIREGAEEMYEKLSPQNNYNPALNVASAFYDAEKQGFEQIFTGFYSTRLFGFKPLFVQLMHETVCKEGEGQTVFGDLGPEFQHHTNQRIFGGEQDVLPVFFRTDTNEREHIEISHEFEGIDLGGRELSELDGMELKESVKSEYQGVKDALDDQDAPNITFNLTKLSHRAAGETVAFLQYVAVYSAWLRDVNPFDQPDVEKSKKKGFEARF
ncbi:hypothetical protein [Candidatus Nanohalococcus occultus]|uniref:Glucose-6-phosphate isomerase n=1 Tax=Candidatus Nanohalococcus occultus TaxID=2978047 RepID=A0ABY8CHI8_9ARCH|nr:Glucose-6-phosphate isomerase [Candidatus Nanohaloarchaeota archaeon SVXNc]